MTILFLIAFLVAGAIAGPCTLLHTFAVGFDLFTQQLGANNTLGITISSRAGLAARKGRNVWFSKLVNFLMRNPNHCELAIQADIQRAQNTLAVLQDRK